MWANQPAPTRNSGWASKGSEAGSASRGASKGAPRGKGRGGRGGRSTNGRGPSKGDNPPKKANGDPAQAQPQVKSPSDSTKSPASQPPPPVATAPKPQANAPSKLAERPKPARKGSEPKATQKATKPVVEIPATISKSNSASTASPRTPSHRKRSNAQKPQPPPVPSVPRKPTPPLEPAPLKEKITAAAKDVPPHLAPPLKVFDIKHDIDALVERVRAVAMDRPHTPGSHFDWAGDEDDSLPDLDDWGVPSTSNTASSLAEPPQETPPPVSVISPILQNALKPLPSLMDVNIPTPSIRLHEVHDEKREPDTNAGDETPRKSADPATHTPTSASHEPKPSEQAPAATQQTPKLEAAAKPKNPANGTPPANGVSSNAPVAGRPPSTDPLDFPDHSGLESSMHALPTSPSAPSHLGPRPPRGFKPTHGRAHTVGRFKDNNHSDPDRPRKADAFSHGRNHSTPPTGTAHRPPASRPVITVDAISRLARTLGGSPLPKRDREPAAAAKAE